MLTSYPDLIRKLFKQFTKFPEPCFFNTDIKFNECTFVRYIVIQEYL